VSTRVRIAFGIVTLVALFAVGCDKTNKDAIDAGTSKENAAPTPSVTSAKPPPRPAEARPVGPVTTIEGVGDVPAWAPDKTTKRCSASAESKTRIEAIRRGTDAAAESLGAGTADVAALARDLGADVCIATRRLLAAALNDAGAARYGVKEYDAANRYRRAALAVRPSLDNARYDLAVGLARAGKTAVAVAQLAELARAAAEGDAAAVNRLAYAKVDDALANVRETPAFQALLQSASQESDGGTAEARLVGPRKDPVAAAQAVALLPEDFKKLQDEIGATPNRAIVTFKPAFTNFWTWHPDPSTELLVATVASDPAKVGQPKADVTLDYGAIAVLRRDATGKLTLLTVRKTGDSPPIVAAGKNGSVIYSFEQVCGALSGRLTWNGKSIDMTEKNCRDLS
jgi:hypothetical protein